MEFRINESKLKFVQGDIAKIAADAIVNAANSQLVGGGGVDGAIHRAGGPSVMAELVVIRTRIGRCPAGDAVVTGAGRLPAKWVIHTVGPIYRDGRQGEAEKLASCYRRSLELAAEHGARAVTFPAVSTGVYGYPVEDAARVSIEAVRGYLEQVDCAIEQATFVLFSAGSLRAFEAAGRTLLGGGGSGSSG